MPSLGNDLAEIRKELNVPLEDIHKATKIPIHILNAIEDDSIFSEIDQNITYIRSYIRSYGKQLNIDEDRIIRALDQVEQGTYSGLLQEGYEGPLPKFQSRHKEKEAEVEVEVEKDEKSDETDDEPDKPVESRPSSKPDSASGTDKFSAVPSSETPTIQSVDWVDMGKKFTPLQSRSRMWIGVAALAVILTAAGLIYYLNLGPETASPESANNSPATTEAIQADSLQLNLADPGNSDDTSQNESAGPAESLSDTLGLVIYAAYEKLEPVRVYTDVTASLNPYWIELGEAVRFRFVNTIRIRGPYDRMELLLNGHLIENFRNRFLNQESGSVEISREIFEGDPKWLQPPPDSLGLNVPDPQVIRDQPIFN